jgi:hypothetical protein
MEDRLDPKDLLSSHFSVTCRTVGISAELTYDSLPAIIKTGKQPS